MGWRRRCDLSEDHASSSPGSWPARIWGLALLGGGIGVAIHFILPVPSISTESYGAAAVWQAPTPTQLALATFLGVAGLALGYVVERRGEALSLGFALLAGAVTAQVVGQAGAGGMESTEVWRLVCACLAVAIAAPLFQAWRERPAGRRLPEYAAAHDHAWTNLVLWFASFAFLGIVWALAFLLGALFDLIGIDLLRKLLERQIVEFSLTGAALWAGIGLLRDRSGLLGSLRRVISTVLAVLAPVLAAGLLLFVLALPFTGLAPLWAATRSTTPILLSVMAGALILLNAVIGDSDADALPSPLLRRAAMVLAAVLLPLAGIAALSVGIRVDEHGLTPDRLWAITFVIIATAYAAAAAAALFRGLPRLAGWQDRLRGGNLVLAMLVCGSALLLSTPLIDFGAISARNQLARLARGAVPPDRFDWAALRFDFGDPGRAALRRLAATGAPAVRERAAAALKAENRYVLAQRDDRQRRIAQGEVAIATLPAGRPVPPALRDILVRESDCFAQVACVLVFEAADSVLALPLDDREFFGGPTRFQLDKTGAWRNAAAPELAPTFRTDAARLEREAKLRAAVRAGRIELRPAPSRQQLYVDGKPLGSAFETNPPAR